MNGCYYILCLFTSAPEIFISSIMYTTIYTPCYETKFSRFLFCALQVFSFIDKMHFCATGPEKIPKVQSSRKFLTSSNKQGRKLKFVTSTSYTEDFFHQNFNISTTNVFPCIPFIFYVFRTHKCLILTNEVSPGILGCPL